MILSTNIENVVIVIKVVQEIYVKIVQTLCTNYFMTHSQYLDHFGGHFMKKTILGKKNMSIYMFCNLIFYFESFWLTRALQSVLTRKALGKCLASLCCLLLGSCCCWAQCESLRNKVQNESLGNLMLGKSLRN